MSQPSLSRQKQQRGHTDGNKRCRDCRKQANYPFRADGKVADKLAGMCKIDKDNYDKYWDDISPFIKYGCLKDDKFCEKMTDYILFKDLDGKYLTLPEALEVNKTDPDEKASAVDEDGNKVEAEVVDEKKEEDKTAEEEKKERTIYYVTNEQQQGQYIRMFRDHKLQAFILNSNIDSPFIQQLEMKNEGIHFARIDAGVDEVLKGRTSKKDAKALEEQSKELEKTVRKALGNDKLKVVLENLKEKNVSSLLKVDEQSRRMQDMMKMYSMGGSDLGMFGDEGQTLILNAKHPLVQYVEQHQDEKNAQSLEKIHLRVGFTLRCFQRLSFPNLATLRCPWQNNSYTSGLFNPVLSY